MKLENNKNYKFVAITTDGKVCAVPCVDKLIELGVEQKSPVNTIYFVVEHGTFKTVKPSEYEEFVGEVISADELIKDDYAEILMEIIGKSLSGFKGLDKELDEGLLYSMLMNRVMPLSKYVESENTDKFKESVKKVFSLIAIYLVSNE